MLIRFHEPDLDQVVKLVPISYGALSECGYLAISKSLPEDINCAHPPPIGT